MQRRFKGRVYSLDFGRRVLYCAVHVLACGGMEATLQYCTVLVAVWRTSLCRC